MIQTLFEMSEQAVSQVMANGPVREGVADGFIWRLDRWKPVKLPVTSLQTFKYAPYIFPL